MLPRVISQDIVKYFHIVEGFSLEEIADITSMSVENVKATLNGLYTFKTKNIVSITNKTSDRIISILAKACPESHLPKNIKKHVSLYKHLQEVKRRKK